MKQDQITILFADDDSEDRDHLLEAFHQIDPAIELVTVRNGAEVLDYLEKCPDNNFPSLLVLDFNMPMVNGLEVLVKMSKDTRYASIPRVMYSTSDSPMHIDLCKHAGAKKYFVKPNHKKELIPIAQEMILLLAS